MQRGIAIVVAGQNFKLGMHDEQVAGIAIQFDFAVDCQAHARFHAVFEVRAMEPFAEERLGRSIGEDNFKKSKAAAAKARELSALHLHDDGGHFAGRDLSDGLDVAAVFVTEGDVAKKVFDGKEALGLEKLGARRPHALYVHERCRKVQRQSTVYNDAV